MRRRIYEWRCDCAESGCAPDCAARVIYPRMLLILEAFICLDVTLMMFGFLGVLSWSGPWWATAAVFLVGGVGSVPKDLRRFRRIQRRFAACDPPVPEGMMRVIDVSFRL